MSKIPEEYHINSYHLEIPTNVVAQTPCFPRDHSKLLKLSLQNHSQEHFHFYDLPEILPKETVLIVNNTRVLPARLIGKRPSGGQIEALLSHSVKEGVWEALIRRSKRIKKGEILEFAGGQIRAKLLEQSGSDTHLLEFENPECLEKKLEKYGVVPLPPYIENTEAASHRESYQTCFAKSRGAVAAPTAGLHFTSSLLERVKKRHIPVIEVTLHVGFGTFSPIRCLDIRQHQMHSEYFEITQDAFEQLQEAIAERKRVIAVGTTSLRVLETLAKQRELSRSGWTNLYIYPPYQFHWTQGIITNFHMPKSTLFLLICAFYGKEKTFSAYQTAIHEGYRFFSYGDSTIIF